MTLVSKDVKIVIGANYGDESKGLITRHFARTMPKSIVVLHNGSAQRGHTVDYSMYYRHVYHHFGCGTADGVPTYFAETFWIHPMEFVREYKELELAGIKPVVYCHPDAKVITPFDMLMDHITEDWIALQHSGQREYGSCGLGTWCAIESRQPHNVFTVRDYINKSKDWMQYLLETTWYDCLAVLISRGVDLGMLPQYKDYFIPDGIIKKNTISHFIDDMRFFINHVLVFNEFKDIYKMYDSIIFEGAQGLGLDKDVDNDWHTTSKTGLYNPFNMLDKYKDFNAEVCYVTRSYLTRHGVGPLEEAVKKEELNKDIYDYTNIPNDFQGSLRFGYLADKYQKERIEKDWALVKDDNRFSKAMAVTHCNEFPDEKQDTKYFSNNPYVVYDRSV